MFLMPRPVGGVIHFLQTGDAFIELNQDSISETLIGGRND
jgi:hypothetical protein